MTEYLRRTDEHPDFDTYPSPELHPERPDLNRPELPPARARSEARGTRAAGAVGSAIGSAVSAVRHAPERLQDAGRRFGVIRGRRRERAAGTAREWRDAASERIENIRHVAGERAGEWRRTAEHRLVDVRERASRAVNDYPIQTILAAGAAGLVLGAVLRAWRSHGE